MAPTVMVTGMRHSGTTYVFRLLEACGLEGGGDRRQENERQGEEWAYWRLLGSEIGRELGRSREPDRPGWTKIDKRSVSRVRKEYEETLREMAWPELVKLPDYGWSALLDVIDPQVLAVVVRDEQSWLGSIKGNWHAREKLTDEELLSGRSLLHGQLLGFADEYGIPYVEWPFPEIAEDVDEAYARYVETLEETDLDVVDEDPFEAAWEQVTRPEWIGETARSLNA